MPSDTRATLRQLILDHGRTLATDPRRCEAMLRDLCADQRREVNLLINALREQIGADLLTSAEPVAMRLARLSRRLEDHLSLKPEAAVWAVETWALVLGVIEHPQPVAPTPAPSAPAPMTPQPAARPRVRTPPAPPPPAVPDIHGWSAAQVQRQQQSAAEALSLPVAFCDRLAQGGLGPELMVIPAGSFLMGSPEGEEGRFDWEGPQHRVTLARPFGIGRFTVTFDDYDAFCAVTKREKPDDQGWGRGRQPVINVSWDDAAAYCQWVSAQTGQGYRLPSEAEWEYGCRAGTTTPFHFGATLSTAQANYNGNDTYGSGALGQHRRRTVAMGSLPANPWGLHEIHGNVWEWCEDCRNGSYDGAPTDGSASRHGDCRRRVLRGGSWYSDPRGARAAIRSGSAPEDRSYCYGFRLARTL